MKHFAFKESPAPDFYTVICVQCNEELQFAPNHELEAVEMAKTAHRRRCPLKVCLGCRKTRDGVFIDSAMNIDASHGYCQPCGEVVVRNAMLFVGRTGELATPAGLPQ